MLRQLAKYNKAPWIQLGTGNRTSMVSKGQKKINRSYGRGKHVRVKTARGRKMSSTLWLQRQLNDPFVREAQRLGYRSRAAFKLLELDDRYGFLKKGARVVDLGAAPGGWSQIAKDRVGNSGSVVALDLASIQPLPGVDIIEVDFFSEQSQALIVSKIGTEVDVVLSDMAAPSTGHTSTDHLRIMSLAEAAYDFARPLLAKGGTFVTKVFQGGTDRDLLKILKRDFATVRHAKPKSSRVESAEMYMVAMGSKIKD